MFCLITNINILSILSQNLFTFWTKCPLSQCLSIFSSILNSITFKPLRQLRPCLFSNSLKNRIRFPSRSSESIRHYSCRMLSASVKVTIADASSSRISSSTISEAITSVVTLGEFLYSACFLSSSLTRSLNEGAPNIRANLERT